MELKEIVSIAGIGGLHKIIGRTKTGLILESMNETKKRFATGIQDKVSVLEDISMYTTEGDMRLAEVLVKLNERGDVPSPKDSPATLRAFLVSAINLDSERVYDSDIKKLLTWFHSLKDIVDFSKLLDEPATEETADAAVEADAPKAKTKKAAAKKGTEEEVKAEEKEKPKAAAKKTTATKTPKTTAPKNSAPKANSKGAGGSKTTYRPKSV